MVARRDAEVAGRHKPTADDVVLAMLWDGDGAAPQFVRELDVRGELIAALRDLLSTAHFDGADVSVPDLLEAAQWQAEMWGHAYLGTEHVLAGALALRRTATARLSREQGLFESLDAKLRTMFEREVVHELPRLTLFDRSGDLVRAWEQEFHDVGHASSVVLELGEVEPHDCLVSPANSFGIMDGGIDGAIAFLLDGIQQRVSEAIAGQWLGEQPVGTSMLVKTGHEQFPWLAHTPTMRSPRPIPRENVYDAMRALLMTIKRHNATGPAPAIASIACPGLGTLTGRVSAGDAARMMRLAWRDVFERETQAFRSWGDVEPHLRELRQP